jgi:hypothetical protein
MHHRRRARRHEAALNADKRAIDIRTRVPSRRWSAGRDEDWNGTPRDSQADAASPRSRAQAECFGVVAPHCLTLRAVARSRELAPAEIRHAVEERGPSSAEPGRKRASAVRSRTTTCRRRSRDRCGRPRSPAIRRAAQRRGRLRRQCNLLRPNAQLRGVVLVLMDGSPCVETTGGGRPCSSRPGRIAATTMRRRRGPVSPAFRPCIGSSLIGRWAAAPQF